MIPRNKRLERHTELRAKKRDSLRRRAFMRRVKMERGKGKRNRHGIPVLEPTLGCAFKVKSGGREVCCDNDAGLLEYTRRRNLMWERQNGICALCGEWMNPNHPDEEWRPSFDHENGRGMGGAKRDDRIEVKGKIQNACVHKRCNTDKGSRRIPYLYQVQAEVSA